MTFGIFYPNLILPLFWRGKTGGGKQLKIRLLYYYIAFGVNYPDCVILFQMKNPLLKAGFLVLIGSYSTNKY
jgi:hypothetical protein